MKEQTIELMHPFNKERMTVPVELITPTFVSIRWGQSGLYDLHIKTNTLVARSHSARRKGRCHWMAVDIALVRNMVRIHVEKADIRDIVRNQREHHEATMPKGLTSNPGIAKSK